jgi:uncharacterized cupin superfamily protein
MIKEQKNFMKKPILNIEDVQLQPRPPQYAAKGELAQKYDAKMGMIGPLIGAQKLGYNITSVPVGKCAFPMHNHRVNEEMFFVLEGTGEVRIGKETYAIRKGDVIACPPGDKETAHQIINTGKEELRYLSVSTKMSPEICDYPDSGKFGILADKFMYVGRETESLDYWEGN